MRCRAPRIVWRGAQGGDEAALVEFEVEGVIMQATIYGSIYHLLFPTSIYPHPRCDWKQAFLLYDTMRAHERVCQFAFFILRTFTEKRQGTFLIYRWKCAREQLPPPV